MRFSIDYAGRLWTAAKNPGVNGAHIAGYLRPCELTPHQIEPAPAHSLSCDVGHCEESGEAVGNAIADGSI